MITLVKTKDPILLTSFMKGEGITRRCWGGFEPQEVDLKMLIHHSKATFLVAYDDGFPKGFVMLNPESEGVFSIHLCLKTIGIKTKEAFALALLYAKDVLRAEEIKAAYPASYRACRLITQFFGFSQDDEVKQTPVPYVFEKLYLV